MPTSVAEAFAAAGLARHAVVKWGTRPTTSSSGVYVVALTSSLDDLDATLSRPPLANDAFEAWMSRCPELMLDGIRPSVDQLKRRIKGFWLPDETIVYIGLAATLSSRLGAYYRTPIGVRRPHSGGYFLKLLSNLDDLWVHYAPCADPASAEDAMIGRFCADVTDETKRALIDPQHPFPFANLEWPPGVRKAHGLRGAREPRSLGRAEVSTAAGPEPVRAAVKPTQATTPGNNRTQRVTAADLRDGHIRIPAFGAAPTKALFPTTKADVAVTLRGTSVRCSWDPRMGPDRERSGVLRVGATLRQLIEEDEVLTVETGDGTSIVIG